MGRLHRVSIATDAHYRQAGTTGAFMEVCTQCEAVRRPNALECDCGRPFSKKERGFFKARFEPPDLAIIFPHRCPKTLGATTRSHRYASRRTTGVHKEAQLGYDVPVGPTLRGPSVALFVALLCGFFGVVAGLAALFSVFDAPARAAAAGGASLLCFLGLVWALREYTWFRLAFFDHRRVVFKVRRLDYALELARNNHGRVGRR